MRSVIKYVFISMGALLGLALVALLVLSILGQAKLNDRLEISVEPLPIPDSESARARGEHLVRAVSGCAGCHGPDLGGQAFIDDPFLGQIYAPNLTSGTGGAAYQFSSKDWARALRHGLDSDGRRLLFMPAQNFRAYGDEDLGAIIAYIRSLPPVDRETPPVRLSLPGRILFALGSFGELPAEMIEHQTSPPDPPAPGITPDYGEFLVTVASCRDCHGENLAGGRAAPDDPFAPNLTQGGELVGWTEEDFLTLIRKGVHPSGRRISTAMPWQTYSNMTDMELQAIWAFLKEQPALPANEE